MQNGDAGFSHIDFTPLRSESPTELLCPVFVEDSIVGAIIEGSGGPDNGEITEMGLRFVRYLLSISRAARHGFVPNLKDHGTIRCLARDFIARSGGPSPAMQTMIDIAGSPTCP